MANTNSAVASGLLTTSTGLTEVGKNGARVRIAQDVVTLVAADIDADGDTVVLAPLPSNARIIRIYFGADDLDTGTDMAWNIGLYDWTKEDGLGTVIDEDFFASAVATQAVTQLTDVTIEATAAAAHVDLPKRLWEVDGETSDPGGFYAVVATQTAAATGAAAGDMAFQILYCVE